MRTAQDVALIELRSRIIAGELQPGQAIRQHAIATDLNLSVVPVREALKILQAEGLVNYQMNRGYTVVNLDRQELSEAYRLRDLLESEALRVSLPQLDSADLRDIADAAKAFEASSCAPDVIAMSKANRRFHFGLMEHCESPRLLHFIRLLWDSTEHYRALGYSLQATRTRTAREHWEILDAVKSEQYDLAIELLTSHRRALVALDTVLEAREPDAIST